MSGHTPGPWKSDTEEPPYDAPIVHVKGYPRRIIATVDYATSSEESTANARLIAAAPDMYALLSHIAAENWDIMSESASEVAQERARALLARIDDDDE